jgi:hypothetical protein
MKMVPRLLTGIVLAAGLATAASAQTKWDMPTPYPDGNFHTKNVIAFAADVDKATKGSLKIQVHSAGSLIKHPEIKRAVRQGTAPKPKARRRRLCRGCCAFADPVPVPLPACGERVTEVALSP